MQRAAPFLLLLVLAVVAVMVFLPSDDETDSATSPGQSATGVAADDELQPAPSVAGGVDRTERRAADPESAVLLRALGPDGQASAKAEFLIARDEGRAELVTSPDGTWLLAAPERRVRVAARAGGRWSAVQTLAPGAAAERQELVLRADTPAARLEVLAVHADNRPLASFEATIEWAMDDGGAGRESLAGLFREADDEHAGANGRAVIEGLPPGTYTLKVETAREVTESTTVKLASLETKTVQLRLEPGAFITGRVLFANGAPAEGATVYLRGSELAMMDASGLPREWWVSRVPDGQKDRTAANGTFRIGPAGANEYRLGVVHPDNPGLEAPDTLEVGIGQALDLGDVVLPESRTLAVVVTRAADGTPIAGAKVVHQSRESKDSMFSVFVDLAGGEGETTDEDGMAKFTGLAPGDWVVGVRAEGLAPAEVDATIPEDVIEQVCRVALQPELRVAGRVVDRVTGQPVAGADVAALLSGDDSLWEDFLPSEALARNAPKAETDADGRFAIGGLQEGDWRLGVSAEGYAKTIDGPFPVAYDLPQPERTVSLTTGGTVIARVLDEKGDPRVGSSVQLYTFGGADGRIEQTDEQGVALFENLSSGDFMLSATNISPDQQFSATSMDQLGGFSQEVRSFRLEENESLTITLGGLVERADIEGFVMEGSEPAESMQVILYSPAYNKFVQTEEDGYYLIESVPNGDYMMMIGSFQMGGGTGWTGSVKVRGTTTVRKDVDLPGAVVKVIVRDAADGKPVAQVPVILRKRDASFGGGNVRTDAKGEAEFLYLGPGEYSLSAGFAAMPFFGGGKQYGTEFIESIVVPPDFDGEKTVEVSLAPAATLKGKVIDLRGEPLQGVGVFFLDDGGQPVTQFDFQGTKRDGSFEISALPAGRGRILARHKEFGQVEREVVLTAGETHEIELTLDTGTLVHIFVTDGSRENVAGVQATLIDERGSPISALFTGMTGWMDAIAFIGGGEQVLGPVPAGKYTVRLAPINGVPVEHELEIAPGTPDVHLQLPYDPD